MVAQKAELAKLADLTPELKDKLLDRVRSGHFLTRACEFVGISKPTFHTWERRARSGEQIYVDLFDAIHEAEHEAEDEAVKDIRGGAKEWKAMAWYLERRYPHWRENNTTDEAPAQIDPSSLAEQIRNRFDGEQLKELIKELDAGSDD